MAFRKRRRGCRKGPEKDVAPKDIPPVAYFQLDPTSYLFPPSNKASYYESIKNEHIE
jgi:hypothetical protein